MENTTDGNERTCPILAAASSGGSNTSTGAYWASRCKRDGCGWWDDKHNCCAVAAISEVLGDIVSARLEAAVR